MASAARNERTCPSQSRLLLRDFSRLPGPNGELAPRLEKMTKARQIAGGGGVIVAGKKKYRKKMIK